MLSFAQNTPLFIQQLLEISTTSSSHQNSPIFLIYMLQKLNIYLALCIYHNLFVLQIRSNQNRYHYLMKKNKQTQDIENGTKQQRSQSMMPDYSKSFAMGGSKKFVNITLPQVQIKGKQQYKKQPYCFICSRNFTTTFRQHHCRVCANAVCGDCSRSMVNKERACDICIMRLSNPHQQRKKKQMLQTLQTLCAFLLYQKKQKMNELEQLKNTEGVQSTQYQQQLSKQQALIKQLEQQNTKLKQEQKRANQELDKIRNQNEKIEEEISQVTNSIIGMVDAPDDD